MAKEGFTLSFDQLRTANLVRCISEFNHPLKMWSLAEWGAATIGEGGEALNNCKKLIRFRDGLGHLNNKSQDELLEMLGEEIADLVIYADLWAAAAGIDLAKVVIAKFNKDSEKHNVKTRLLEGV